ncbi:uncharacterized protein A4U43_C07F28990 [Asparagus officinalis]|uniref:60S ribosomal protein L13a n=1 Tax=Asparagus officinalis TaxID=4686 RepID=A0A5P1EFS2_ASPOF|nr:uncharacterized protein A4U43_C07F28990 [Asparagus officinalis]
MLGRLAIDHRRTSSQTSQRRRQVTSGSRSRPLRRPCPPEDEVPEVLEEEDEHQALPWPHPLQGSRQDPLANHPRTKRGAAALARLKTYEGVPPPYDKIKRMVIPDALKVLRLQAGHKYCLLGQLSKEVGWNHYDTIKELEEKRKQRAQVAYERRKQLAKLRLKAEKVADEKLGPQLDILAPLKY